MSNIFKKYGLESVDADEVATDEITGNEWTEHPDAPDYSDIDEAAEVRDDIGDIADRVEGSEGDVALEDYQWFLGKTLNNARVALPKQFGLENFSDTRKGKSAFVSELRSFEKGLSKSIRVAVEEYSEASEKVLTDLVKENKKISSEFDRLLKNRNKGPLFVRNGAALSIFIVDDYLIKDPSWTEEELETIDWICDAVTDLQKDYQDPGFSIGKWWRSAGTKKHSLLMNKQLVVEKDKIKIVRGETDVEKLITKSIRENAKLSLLSNGIYLVAAFATPSLTNMYRKIGVAISSITTAVSLVGLIKARDSAAKEANREYSDVAKAMYNMLKLSTKLPKIVEINNGLSQMTHEKTPHLQSILIELVKHINEIQSKCIVLIKDSDAMDEKA